MTRRDTCYFDGRCGLCRRTVAVLRSLDWLHRLEFADLTTADPEQLPVRPEDALRGMPMRTSRGAALLGFPAVRRALRRTPLGFLPALALSVPGVDAAGSRLYAFVASRRRRDPCSPVPAAERAA